MSEQQKMAEKEVPSPASLRWSILRRVLLSSPPPPSSDDSDARRIDLISRRTSRGFNLVPWEVVDGSSFGVLRKDVGGDRDIYLSYQLPVEGSQSLVLVQRAENSVNLNDIEISNRQNIDNTGLVCQWPSEDVLAYFCLNNADMFRSKRVLELGSGYGLAGLAIAACTDAIEVVISDGNCQVVDYIQRNSHANDKVFGNTKVMPLALHWDGIEASTITKAFDVIIASDCTFFKEYHEGLALTVKSLLKHSPTSEALFFCPRRGDSLDKFLKKIEEVGLHSSVTEKYDNKVWDLHMKFLNGVDSSWPNYDKDHCYPLMVRITL